jgi:hypothetical protein
MSNKGITVRSRLNLKIDNDLKDWVAEYAFKKKTTVTSIICSYFAYLREEERREKEEVEQI